MVIDIPDGYDEVLKRIPVRQSTADMLLIRNGIPLSEVLQDIWREVEKIYPKNQCTGELTGYAEAVEDILVIIDSRIEEDRRKKEE